MMNHLTEERKRGIDCVRTGEQIRDCRIQLNMNVSDFGKRLGISRQAVYKLQNGSLPQIETLFKLSVLFGIRMNDILVEYAGENLPLKAKDSGADVKELSINRAKTGELLRSMREEHKLSLARLSDKIESQYYYTFSTTALHSYEKSHPEKDTKKARPLPSTEHFFVLSKIYDVRIEDLLISDGPDGPQDPIRFCGAVGAAQTLSIHDRTCTDCPDLLYTAPDRAA